jgi:hypothetical protein
MISATPLRPFSFGIKVRVMVESVITDHWVRTSFGPDLGHSSLNIRKITGRSDLPRTGHTGIFLKGQERTEVGPSKSSDYLLPLFPAVRGASFAIVVCCSTAVIFRAYWALCHVFLKFL